VYDTVMKFVLLAFFVLIAAQPLQATFCDMHDTQGTSHGQHGGMQNHHDMDMDGGMDCCDHDPSEPSDNCDSMSHCGASSAGTATINTTPVSVAFATSSHQHLANSERPLSWFSSPPFRPPIT
jgi:hypothetical protein